MTGRTSNMREKLRQRTQESYDHKDDSGRFRSIFKSQLPEGIEFWTCKAEDHVIDIVPYIAGSNNPRTPEGEPAYVLDVWVHQRVGPNDDNYLCPARNWQQPCPVCEYAKELREDGDADEELLKKMYPKRRVIYNILCWDSAEEEKKGIQIWEVAHWFMENNLMPLTKPQRGEGTVVFSDPSAEGKSVAFRREGSGAANTKFLGHRFLDRTMDGKPYSLADILRVKDDDAVAAEAYVLDELIHIPSYDELYEAFHGRGYAQEEEPGAVPDEEEYYPDEEETRGPSRRRLTDEEAGGRPSEREGPECPSGGLFGHDVERFEDCPTCKLIHDCGMEYDRLQAEANIAKAKDEGLRATPSEVGLGRGRPEREGRRTRQEPEKEEKPRQEAPRARRRIGTEETKPTTSPSSASSPRDRTRRRR